jgi:hypothetical protein
MTNFKVEVTCHRQRRRVGSASLDVGDRLVDLERLGDRDATLGAELVVLQTAKRGGNKIGMLERCYRRGNKNANIKVGVTPHCKTESTTLKRSLT